jgi:cytochrome P450
MWQYWEPECSAGEHESLSYLREHFDPLSEQLTRGRYGRVSGYMAQHCPVAHTDQVAGGIWSVSSYQYLADIHRDTVSFSNYPVLLQDFGNARPMIPMESDPPLHMQYKQTLSPLLSRKVQTEREPFYRRVAKQCVAKFVDEGRCDLFDELCKPLTVQSLMEALGVPARDWDRLAELGFQQARGEGHDAGPQIYDYFAGLMKEKRRNPGDDIISRLCTATVNGRLLTDTEIPDCSVILMPAGFETTASSLGFMFLLLAERPTLQQRLRDEPSLIPSAIEEMMRFVTPTRSHTRTVKTDTTIGEHRFKAGERIHLNWAGANHDPAVFEQPEELVIDRQPNRHMGFGFGTHTCVGIHMARAEMKAALEEVLEAMDDIRISEPDQIVEHPGSTWGVGNLPVEFVPRQRHTTAKATNG